eukprot:Sspe_Gene.115984::Locus_104190_Transcript_1_1_Confidence_1.000_Length_456::g.115984::m.115984
MSAREIIYRKRWLVLKYNIWGNTRYGEVPIATPNVQPFYGSLTARLQDYVNHQGQSSSEKPYWTRTFCFGSKRPNYMMWNVGQGAHRFWGHEWQKYKVSQMEMSHLDLRGPEPR